MCSAGLQTSQVRGVRPTYGGSSNGFARDHCRHFKRCPLQVSYLTLGRVTHCCFPLSGTHLRNVRLAGSSSGECFQTVSSPATVSSHVLALLFYCPAAVNWQLCYRYEDNGDAVNNLLVICKSTGNKSIEDFGSPDKWLQENAKLLGEDVWKGELYAQPGFAHLVRPVTLQVQSCQNKSSTLPLFDHSQLL